MYDLFHSVVIGMIEAFWSVCIKSVELFYNSEVTAQVLKWAFVFVSATCFAWIIWCACEGRWGYSYWWSSHKWRCWPCNWDSKFPGTVLCVLVNILLTLWEIFRLHSFFQLLHMLFALTFRILLCSLHLGWFWDWWVWKLTAVARLFCRLCCRRLVIGKESTGSGTSLLLLMKHSYMFHWYDTGRILTSCVSISNKSTSFIHQEPTS